MITACGKNEFSTHKRYPALRINGTLLALVGTHERYPLPCSSSCSWLPVEARLAVEGARPFPPPGNPIGIPPPPAASTTASPFEIDETEEHSRAGGSKQWQVIRAEGAPALPACHFPAGKWPLSQPWRALKRRNTNHG